MKLEEIKDRHDLIDFKIWPDRVLGWILSIQYYGQNIVFINGGTLEQLLERMEKSQYMYVVNKYRFGSDYDESGLKDPFNDKQ